jgi:hypothetical protein
MFVVDAAVLLPYPPHVIARVVERVSLMPRWCSGLRRVRHLPDPADAAPAAAEPASLGRGEGCLLTYAAADVRLSLRARTEERSLGEVGGMVRHVAEGDGVTLTWTFTVEPEPSTESSSRTRLRARTALSVDPAHPTAAVRPALCRQLARRMPADLERLRALFDRYEYGKRHGGGHATGASIADPAIAILPTANGGGYDGAVAQPRTVR